MPCCLWKWNFLVVVQTIPIKNPLFSGHLTLPTLVPLSYQVCFPPESHNDLKRPIRSQVNHLLKTHHKTQIRYQGLPELHPQPAGLFLTTSCHCPLFTLLQPQGVAFSLGLTHTKMIPTSGLGTPPSPEWLLFLPTQPNCHLPERPPAASPRTRHSSPVARSVSPQSSVLAGRGFCSSFSFVFSPYQLCPKRAGVGSQQHHIPASKQCLA